MRQRKQPSPNPRSPRGQNRRSGKTAVAPCVFDRLSLAIACAAGLIAASGNSAIGDPPTKISGRITPDDANVPNNTPKVVKAANVVREHQLIPFIEMARASRDAVLAVRDYEAQFTRRERVGRTLYSGQMFMKLRHQPFSVYLRFVDQYNGREVIYAGPRYQGKLMAHDAPGTLGSIVGTLSLDPTSPRAMQEGRHPITEIGMAKMMDQLIHSWEQETKFNDFEDPKVVYYPNAKLNNIECEVAETVHENPKHQVRFYRTRVYFEKRSRFPIRLEQYGFPERGRTEPYLMEEYTYLNVRANLGMTDADFDIHNRNYRF